MSALKKPRSQSWPDVITWAVGKVGAEQQLGPVTSEPLAGIIRRHGKALEAYYREAMERGGATAVVGTRRRPLRPRALRDTYGDLWRRLKPLAAGKSAIEAYYLLPGVEAPFRGRFSVSGDITRPDKRARVCVPEFPVDEVDFEGEPFAWFHDPHTPPSRRCFDANDTVVFDDGVEWKALARSDYRSYRMETRVGHQRKVNRIRTQAHKAWTALEPERQLALLRALASDASLPAEKLADQPFRVTQLLGAIGSLDGSQKTLRRLSAVVSHWWRDSGRLADNLTPQKVSALAAELPVELELGPVEDYAQRLAQLRRGWVGADRVSPQAGLLIVTEDDVLAAKALMRLIPAATDTWLRKRDHLFGPEHNDLRAFAATHFAFPPAPKAPHISEALREAEHRALVEDWIYDEEGPRSLEDYGNRPSPEGDGFDVQEASDAVSASPPPSPGATVDVKIKITPANYDLVEDFLSVDDLMGSGVLLGKTFLRVQGTVEDALGILDTIESEAPRWVDQVGVGDDPQQVEFALRQRRKSWAKLWLKLYKAIGTDARRQEAAHIKKLAQRGYIW